MITLIFTIPLLYSGKNNENKIFIVSLFVDSISKIVFCEFQHSTSAKAFLHKNNMERKCKQSAVKSKAFRGNTCVYRGAEFRAELKQE